MARHGNEPVADLREQIRRQTIHLKIMITLSQASTAAMVWWIVKSA